MTERQKEILFAIVEQYAEVASPVGSVTLAKLFGVSSATIRSEMAKLEELGYITAPHTSSGRIPTDTGYRIYVNNITDASMGELPAGVDRSVKTIDAHIQSHSSTADQVIRSAVNSLVELTDNLSFATIGGEIYMNGIANLFMQPEFAEVEPIRAVASLIDNIEPWLDEVQPNQPLNVYIGSENPIGKQSGATLIISKFRSPYSDRSYIGVVGPTRQNYARTMHFVQRAGKVLEDALSV